MQSFQYANTVLRRNSRTHGRLCGASCAAAREFCGGACCAVNTSHGAEDGGLRRQLIYMKTGPALDVPNVTSAADFTGDDACTPSMTLAPRLRTSAPAQRTVSHHGRDLPAIAGTPVAAPILRIIAALLGPLPRCQTLAELSSLATAPGRPYRPPAPLSAA